MITFDENAIPCKPITGQLPARVTTIGGSSYSVGTKIRIVGFAYFPNPSDPTKPDYLGAMAIINESSSQPVSLNALTGRYYGATKRESIENGLDCGGEIPKGTLESLVGKTLEVEKLSEVSVRQYNADRTAKPVMLKSTMPFFKVVE